MASASLKTVSLPIKMYNKLRFLSIFRHKSVSALLSELIGERLDVVFDELPTDAKNFFYDRWESGNDLEAK